MILATFAPPANASFTTVEPTPHATELTHEEVFEALYLGDFMLSGNDFIGMGPLAGINAIRVDDDLDPLGILNVVLGLPGSAADQVWDDGAVTATAEARYATYTQQFGLDRGQGVEVLFDVVGSGLAVTGNAVVDISGDTWTWVRRNTDGTNAYYSEDARNPDGLDHMVTYRMEGLDTDETVWQVFWEDVPGPLDDPSDRDFNDLVVEIRAVPEPATLALLLAAAPFAIRRRK
jgi:hypothetical protein